MWFIPALVTVLAWGTADLFYKKGNDPSESFSAFRTVIMVGVVMGAHAILYMMFYKQVSFEWFNLIKYLQFQPCIFYRWRLAMLAYVILNYRFHLPLVIHPEQYRRCYHFYY